MNIFELKDLLVGVLGVNLELLIIRWIFFKNCGPKGCYSPAISEISPAIFGKVHNELLCAYFQGRCRRIRDEVPNDRVLGTAPTLVQQQITPRHAHAGTI